MEVRNGMAEVAYASSIIGFREFDKKYFLTDSTEEVLARLESDFVTPATERFPNPESKQFFGQIMERSLFEAVHRQPHQGTRLVDARPTYEIFMSGHARGAGVSVFLEVDPAFKGLLALPADGLVSAATDMIVGRDPQIFEEVDGGDFSLPLELPWKDDALRGLVQAVDIPYSLSLRFSDGTKKSLAGRLRVNPVAQVELIYPWELGFTTMVDELHPWVQRIINDVAGQPWVRQQGFTLTGAGGGVEDRLLSLYLVWRDLAARKIAYQNLSAADRQSAQRVRPIHESLSDRSANCIDGAVLLSSFMQAMGMRSDIVLVPGHAFLGVWLADEIPMFVETTQLGAGPLADDPRTQLDEWFASLRSKHPALKTSDFNRFELACEMGRKNVEEAINEAAPWLGELNRLMEEGAKMPEKSDDWWRHFDEISQGVARQIQFIPVSIARDCGVRPIGHPADLDTSGKYRFPERR